jgi:outer membrane protein OmpA-like peptidoglycan-associated protein
MRMRVATQGAIPGQADHFSTGVPNPLERSGNGRRQRGGDLEAQAANTADRLVSPARRTGMGSEFGSISRGSDTVPPQAGPASAAGRPVDSEVSAHVGRALGCDFSTVRIHDDRAAARLTDRLGAYAATFGTHIAFAAGQYRPSDTDGRRLLTHELVHVAQQRMTGPLVQLAAKDSPHFANTLTLNWDIRFKLNRPTAAEPFAAPDTVLTPEGLSDFRMMLTLLIADPRQLAQVEGSASIEGNPAENDRLSARRAQWIAKQIGPQRVQAAPGNEPDCRELADGEYACGTSHAREVADPADRRATVRLFQPPAPLGVRITPPAAQPAPPQPPARTTQDATKDAAPGRSPGGSAEPAAGGPNQVAAQGGFGYTRHHYTTPAQRTDPLGEWVAQAVAAYTRQIHRENQAGLELQFPIQVQYSLTTRQWSVASGLQLSYIVPFGGGQFQWSAFAQALAGPNISADSWLFQPAAGTQLTWQPANWLTLAGQITAGYTTQTSGPSSRDVSGMFVITFQKQF